jgi:hypothetical protein
MLKKVWKWIKGLVRKADDLVEKALPVATAVVEGVKKAIDSGLFDAVSATVKSLIPGTADDVLIDKAVSIAKKQVPKLALQLQIVSGIAGIEDENEQMKAIFKALGESSGVEWQKFCTGLAQEVLIALADDKITWGEAGGLVEYYYRNYINKQNGTT